MKKITLIIVVLAFASCGYKPPVVTPVTIEPISKVFDVNASKDQLFVRANKWMIAMFNNSESVVEYSDKEAGVVAGKYLLGKTSSRGTGLAASYVGPENNIFSIITIEVKDNAAKITLSPQTFERIESQYLTEYGINEQSAREKIDSLIASFGESINTESEF